MNKTMTTLALLSAVGSLYAAEESRMRNLENRVTSLEQTQNTCCVINPSGRPFTPDCWGFIVSIDPLIWQAHVNGTGFVIETENTPDFFNENGTSHVRNLDFDWNWGFRLGLGINHACDEWDTILYWTHWKTDARESVSSRDGNALYPVWGHPARTFGQIPGSAKATWDLHYNILDLENGREFYVSKCLTLRPFGGLRTAWVKQKFDIEYNNIGGPNPITPAISHDVDLVDRFWGIGIRGGVDMQWGLNWGFSIFSNFAGSLLYAYHSSKHDETAGFPDGTTQNIVRLRDFFHVGTAIFDSQIGLRFDWLSCNECFHLGFDLGWELHYLPGQNQFIKFMDDGMSGKFAQNGGDLGIMGFFLKIRTDF